MVRVILHVGMPKTGSSSVQAAFAEQRDLLARHGFFYPQFEEGRMPGHWALGAFWREHMVPGYHLIRRLDRLGPKEEVFAKVRREIARAIRRAEAFGDGVVLLSDEHLTNAHAGPGCLRLTAMLQRHGGALEVLAYMRPDPDLIPSAAQQQLKRYGRRLDITTMSHLRKLEDVTRAFGTERVKLRIFGRETLTAGDAVSDICQWIGQIVGRPLPDFGPVARVNESIPAPACALLQRLSAGVAEGADDSAFAKVRWSAMNSLADIPAPRLTLPAGWRQRIEANIHTAWNEMVAGCDHPQALRDRVMMAALPSEPELTSQDLCDWVGAGWDPDYNQRLRDWIAARPEPWSKRALALLDGLAAPE